MLTPMPKTRKRSLAPPTPTPDSAGRPKIAKKLDHSRENNPNSVWCTTDHDYIATQCESSDVPHDFQSQTVSSLQDHFEKLQGKLLRIENIKNNDTNFSFGPIYQIMLFSLHFLLTWKQGHLMELVFCAIGEVNLQSIKWWVIQGIHKKANIRGWTFLGAD